MKNKFNGHQCQHVDNGACTRCKFPIRAIYSREMNHVDKDVKKVHKNEIRSTVAKMKRKLGMAA